MTTSIPPWRTATTAITAIPSRIINFEYDAAFAAIIELKHEQCKDIADYGLQLLQLAQRLEDIHQSHKIPHAMLITIFLRNLSPRMRAFADGVRLNQQFVLSDADAVELHKLKTFNDIMILAMAHEKNLSEETVTPEQEEVAAAPAQREVIMEPERRQAVVEPTQQEGLMESVQQQAVMEAAQREPVVDNVQRGVVATPAQREVVVKQEVADDSGIEVDITPITDAQRRQRIQDLLQPMTVAFNACKLHPRNFFDHTHDQCPDFGPARGNRGKPPTELTNTLHVSNLVLNVDGDAIRDVFAEFGNVRSVVVRHDGEIGDSWCWVVFDNVAAASRALRVKHGAVFAGWPLAIKYADRNSADSVPEGVSEAFRPLHTEEPRAVASSSRHPRQENAAASQAAGDSGNVDENMMETDNSGGVDQSHRKVPVSRHDVRLFGDPGFVPCDYNHRSLAALAAKEIRHQRNECPELNTRQARQGQRLADEERARRMAEKEKMKGPKRHDTRLPGDPGFVPCDAHFMLASEVSHERNACLDLDAASQRLADQGPTSRKRKREREESAEFDASNVPDNSDTSDGSDDEAQPLSQTRPRRQSQIRPPGGLRETDDSKASDDDEAQPATQNRPVQRSDIRLPGDPGFVPCDYPHRRERAKRSHQRNACPLLNPQGESEASREKSRREKLMGRGARKRAKAAERHYVTTGDPSGLLLLQLAK